ncbi:MAG: sensor histidine kinase [Thermoanaerobaculia bacterium]
MPERGEPPPWELSARELALIFGFWTAFAVVTVLPRLLDPRMPGFPGGSRLVLVSFLQAWVWAALTPLIFWLVSRYGPDRLGWLAFGFLFLGVGIVLAGFVDTIVDVLRVQVVGFNPRRAGRFVAFRGIRRLWFLNDLIVYVAIVAAGFARDFFLRYRARQAEAVALRAQLAESRLESLRMQLNPHFLFNTLNAISALVERDPRGVRRMIARLSELLRHTIESAAVQEVRLDRELDLLDRYIDIMKVRFQDALRVELRIDADARRALVPPLILQPLVENAIEHGTRRTTAPGMVEIAIRREGERLALTVRDNGPGPGVPADQGTRIGLENTRERLRQLYGPAASLRLDAAEGGGAVARIEIPFRRAPEDEP